MSQLPVGLGSEMLPPAQPPVPVDLSNPLAPLIAPQQQFLTNLPVDDAWGDAVLTKCLADADDQLPAVKDTIIEVKWYVAHLVHKTDRETGEVIVLPRVCLIAPNGRIMAWANHTTTKYFGVIMSRKGRGPWNPPLRIRVTAKPGREQGQFYTLSLEVPEPPQTAPAGRKGK